MKIKLDELQAKVSQGVVKLGYEGEDAQAIIDTLLYAEMRGNNQGITKIATGGVPYAKDIQEFKTVKENKCGALLSGGHSMVASMKGAEMAADLADKHGVGVVGVNHTFTSSGAIGAFSRQIAKRGHIGLVCVGNGSFAFVAPTGSSDPRLGTNPMSYAFPYNGGEVVFDTTTAAMAFFGIIESKLKGEQLPEGIGFDKDGNPSTNPVDVIDGSIATFAEHKGFGLSLLVQVLGGAFCLAGTPQVDEEDGSGTFIIAIDPALLAGKDEYMRRTTELINQIKSSKPLDGQQVYLPGEQGDTRVQKVLDTGEIEIADEIWNELCGFVDGK